MRFFSLLKKIGLGLLVYFIYLGLSVCFYNIQQINSVTKDAKKSDPKPLKTLYTNKIQNESACVTADLNQALALRCQLVDEAKETLFVSQYAISDDDSGLIFIGKLLEAAQRGVKVKLLLNSLATEMTITSRIPFEIFRDEENIEIKTIGGLNLLKPWEVNNILHDKLILVDDNYFISSGRNIGNRFMLKSKDYEATYDFDLIIKKDGQPSKNSLIKQGNVYFNELWKAPYAVDKSHSSRPFTGKAVKNLQNEIRKARNRHELVLRQDVLSNLSFHRINAGMLIHNPVGKIVKSPVVWQKIVHFLEDSQEATLQSPYVIISDKMKQFQTRQLPDKLSLITNSAATSPNLFAYAGYLKQKEQLNSKMDIWEYQGDGSLHHKALLLDRRVGAVGSFNLDSRSAFLSSENMVFIDSPGFHDQLKEIMTSYQAESLQVKNQTTYKKSDRHPRIVHPTKEKLLTLISKIIKPLEFLL
ncbi:phospholipase D-like domain-containing protein [Enterococcus malodoratus]|uniref:PLD phosphodiesterase domain-containing protein n=1 Tax=Enterococcus malodoratus ATCC 43197 TaxID=1158601 RepID=R2RED2_9ENTE|nr:phospholipase D-like domain-containing protein [Enterococcus malodoratus]EOH74339.1 hypothetical protein UAI_03408 [Enterococcus malodoratus ATCC 43197]EOT67069.1 hypothetical protein I585_02590 [Enterococcus malodoratus ATCC 43197]OJG58675.1 hypothetical protein RV07_GL002854 [Enterococcus malodoratus]SPW91052.1 cardiolipin synthetase [Enterococcus malodoratus]STD69679.1 cardiolipin synthetase [Enterococcus malodoratus]